MVSCFSQILDDIVVRSAEALFHNGGIGFERTSSAPLLRIDERHVGGLIAFEGPQMRGALLLVSNFETAVAMRMPTRSGVVFSSRAAADWIVIRDWIAELANQLLGRIKNRLHSFDLNFQIGAAVPLSGRGLSLAVQMPDRARRFVFRRGDHVVQILVNLREEPHLASMIPSAGGAEAAHEGDVIEF